VLKQANLPSHEVRISVAKGDRTERWQNQVKVSPLAVLQRVRDDVWGIHRPGDLSKEFLTTVLRLPHNEPSRAQLLTMTGKCGNRDVVAGWLRVYRLYQRRRQPREGGAFAVDTARSVLTAITREDLGMADQLLIGVLSAAPHSSLLRVLEVWLAAERGDLDADEARFGLASIPINDPMAAKVAKVLKSQGPVMGSRRKSLASNVLRKLK